MYKDFEIFVPVDSNSRLKITFYAHFSIDKGYYFISYHKKIDKNCFQEQSYLDLDFSENIYIKKFMDIWDDKQLKQLTGKDLEYFHNSIDILKANLKVTSTNK